MTDSSWSKLPQAVAAAIVFAAVAAQSAAASDVTTGGALAQQLCARCHAIGATGTSKHESAPPFRELANKWPDTGVLAEAFAEGIVVGHPDMPEFELSTEQIGGLLAYLESLRD